MTVSPELIFSSTGREGLVMEEGGVWGMSTNGSDMVFVLRMLLPNYINTISME